MGLIRAKSLEQKWNVNMGGLARIWKGGCIIRAAFLDTIKDAYYKWVNLLPLLFSCTLRIHYLYIKPLTLTPKRVVFC
jgi:6-phosphogluconate dehydrogenase